ncbi:MAG: hypothetical protein ACTMIU_00995 [Alcaligenes aquatilis]
MRIHFGPGYRLYDAREGPVVYLLLSGGDKPSQKQDIKTAIACGNKFRGISHDHPQNRPFRRR